MQFGVRFKSGARQKVAELQKIQSKWQLCSLQSCNFQSVALESKTNGHTNVVHFILEIPIKYEVVNASLVKLFY